MKGITLKYDFMFVKNLTILNKGGLIKHLLMDYSKNQEQIQIQ
jgi:hypothetical protein